MLQAFERYAEKKGKVSEVFEELPRLDEYEQIMWLCYVRLDSCRQGLVAISMTDIIAYSNEFDLPTEEVIEIVKSLDMEHLKAMAKRNG